MYDKKTKYSATANNNCTYCKGKGYLEIFNAYDKDFLQVERCPLCMVWYTDRDVSSFSIDSN